MNYPPLYGIIDLGYVRADDALLMARQLIAGGVGIIQLRAKSVPHASILALAHQISPLCAERNVIFIVNDYVDIALASDAAGVHLGQDDGGIAQARNQLAKGKIVGKSTHSLAQAQQAYNDGADYIGFGPLYSTATKPGRVPIGLGDIRTVHELLPDYFPIYCIGGINPSTLPEAISAGAQRVVVVSWLLAQPDPAQATSALMHSLVHLKFPLASHTKTDTILL